MITNYYALFVAVGMVLLLSACSPTKEIYRGLVTQPVSLSYLYDSPAAAQRSSLTVSMTSPDLSAADLRQSSQLEKTKSSVLPLLVYNRWKSEFTYTLGKTSTQEEITNFIQTAWLAESYRSGLYLPDTNAVADLQLEIEIDSAYARGPYKADGVCIFALVAYSYAEWEYAGPGIAYSRFVYRLKEGEKVLWEKAAESTHSSQLLSNQAETVQKLRKDYTTHLVESLSLTFKDNLEEVVEEVNRYIGKNYAGTLSTPSDDERKNRLEKSIDTAPLPQAKIVLYRRGKKEISQALSITLEDGTSVKLQPNSFQELSVPLRATEFCIDGNCTAVVPLSKSVQYVECSYTKKDQVDQTRIENVKPKVGSFYVRQIGHLQNKRK